MVDIAVLSAALSGISTAIDLAKGVQGAYASLDKAELRLKLLDLLEALTNAKLQVMDLVETLRAKDEEIRALRDQLSTHASMEYEAPYYWRGSGKDRTGPFCQRCYDVDGKPIRLQVIEPKRWQCRACKATFNDSDYEPRPLPQVFGRRRGPMPY